MASPSSQVFLAQERLKALLPTITQLRETTGAASVSFGVLHYGDVVLQGTDGFRDAEKQIPANIDTAYVIGSSMKAMMASCCGMLVHEGKLAWDDELSKHVKFHHALDPVLGNRATVHDALSHTTGIAQLDLSWYGASGKNLIHPKDVLHVVAHLPITTRFRSQWSYCNYMYVIMAKVIDHAIAEDGGWSRFLTERLLEPLGMQRSKLSRDAFSDDNVAEPHYVKDDLTPGQLPRPDLSSDTLMGPAGCLWSTVPDMLKWVRAVLTSVNPDRESGHEPIVLKEMDTITAHQTQLAHRGLFENTYGYGWSRLSMPSAMYGFMSTNGNKQEPILGRDSDRRLMLYHGGQVTGFLMTLCIFPEAQSAIVVLSNTQALGDASDWTARAIMQELFELRPSIDLVAQAKLTARQALGLYARLMGDYIKNKSQSEDADLDDKFGVYVNEGLKLHIDIRPTKNRDKVGEFFLNVRLSHAHAQTGQTQRPKNGENSDDLEFMTNNQEVSAYCIVSFVLHYSYFVGYYQIAPPVNTITDVIAYRATLASESR
ncbi:hypothetical protein J7337_007348 [Fusarium musae]|uniref:Beta-lactamase-related domain-containing protein n=1 Tax=Fusarium musae TaxID=1042133 RepID=A0A9P8DH56_9HYPO|nr:hypothetical protein J7337_007348 [Fusarium musae]KAG9501657.1 hypothetical protein J7337_007348 [Fusarium musae]